MTRAFPARVVLDVTHDQKKRWAKAALQESRSLSQWIRKTLDTMTAEADYGTLAGADAQEPSSLTAGTASVPASAHAAALDPTADSPAKLNEAGDVKDQGTRSSPKPPRADGPPLAPGLASAGLSPAFDVRATPALNPVCEYEHLHWRIPDGEKCPHCAGVK